MSETPEVCTNTSIEMEVKNEVKNADEMSLELRANFERTSSELRNLSSREIAEQYGVSERTFQQWFQVVSQAYCWIPVEDLRIGNSAKTRYTPLAQELIAAYREAAESVSADAWVKQVHAANPDRVPSVAQKTQEVDQRGTVEDVDVETDIDVEIGNHQIVLPAPELSKSFSLQGLRSSEMQSISDPLQLAEQFVQVARAITGVMEADLQQRRDRLQQTEAARKMIEQAAQELRLEQRLYRRDANDLSEKVTSATQELQSSLSVLDALRTGKLQEGGGGEGTEQPAG